MTTLLPAAPAITLDKQAGIPSGNTTGSTILYTFIVKNTGNVTLTTVGVTDLKVGLITCPATSLAPNVTTTCTKSYTLTQEDVDAGVFDNSASATGTPPVGAVVTSTDTTSTPITRTSTLTMDKQAGTPTGNTVGSTIPYVFIVTNTGNTTVTELSISDLKVGATDCSATTLTPGQVATCTTAYTLTQADVDAGHVANTATATATPPTGLAKPTATDFTDSRPAAPAITVDKQAGGPVRRHRGLDDRLHVPRDEHRQRDPRPRSRSTDPKVGPVLLPGDDRWLRVRPRPARPTYTLTQADVDSGHVFNTATASATPPTGAAVTGTDSTDSPIAAGPGLTLDKSRGCAVDHCGWHDRLQLPGDQHGQRDPDTSA